MTEDANDTATRPDHDTDDDTFTPVPLTAEQLAALRERLSTNHRFLAKTLRRHREAEGWSHDQLASHLGLTPDGLDRLGLVGQPRADRFAADVRAIASANSVSDFQLMHLLRAVESRDAFTGSAAARGFVAAARDHDEPELEPEEKDVRGATDHDRPEDNVR